MSNFTCRECGKPTNAHAPTCKFSPKAKPTARTAPAVLGDVGGIPVYDEVPFGDFRVSSKPTNGAAPTPAASPAQPMTHAEAPLSVNWTMRDPHGALVQITMRDGCTLDMLTRLFEVRRSFVDRALKADWSFRRATDAQDVTGETDEPAPLCVIHNKPMAKRTKDGRSWWSCTEKLPDGQWCNYRPKSK